MAIVDPYPKNYFKGPPENASGGMLSDSALKRNIDIQCPECATVERWGLVRFPTFNETAQFFCEACGVTATMEWYYQWIAIRVTTPQEMARSLRLKEEQARKRQKEEESERVKAKRQAMILAKRLIDANYRERLYQRTAHHNSALHSMPLIQDGWAHWRPKHQGYDNRMIVGGKKRFHTTRRSMARINLDYYGDPTLAGCW